MQFQLNLIKSGSGQRKYIFSMSDWRGFSHRENNNHMYLPFVKVFINVGKFSQKKILNNINICETYIFIFKNPPKHMITLIQIIQIILNCPIVFHRTIFLCKPPSILFLCARGNKKLYGDSIINTVLWEKSSDVFRDSQFPNINEWCFSQ